MVDVSAKPVTARVAKAETFVKLREETVQAVRNCELRKGDVLAVARLAAIGATKQTAQLIPLCHAIPVEGVEVAFEFSQPDEIRCLVTVRTSARTGVEMEAMTAATVAGLTIYDMCKSIDREISLGPTRLLEKSGGKSGLYVRQS